MSGVTFRKARLDDAKEMARIASSSHAAWTELRFTAELELSQTRAWIAEEEGAIAGFAIGWQVIDELELHLLAIDPFRRKRGIGRALLAAFEGEVPFVYLEVSQHNQAALALYRAAGYTEVGLRADYYGPGDDAVLMERIRR
jgi:ribosomal-protein-alanine acetyltransferase